MCAQVRLREGDGEGRVGGQVELGIPLSPVPRGTEELAIVVRSKGFGVLDDGNVDRSGRARPVDGCVSHCD